MNNQSDQPRIVDGQIVRNNNNIDMPSSFSWRRFGLLALLTTAMVVTNPANELKEKTLDIVDQITGRNINSRTRQRELSDWALHNFVDPPVSITNFGLFTLEERHAKVMILGLTQSWSCPFYDEQKGAFCSALAKNLCHGNPLLYHPKNLAYTAHRTICFMLIACALLAFCYNGIIPNRFSSDPFLRALLTCFCRNHFSFLSLAMDLFNCSMFVYPALARMERIVPTLHDGKLSAVLGVPQYFDFIFYTGFLVLFLGGGSNSLANYFFKRDPCFGFDTTVAAAVAYCSAIPAHILPFDGTTGMLTPQTVFWGYLPVTALLGGSPAHAVAWMIAGSFGVMLAQYHADNQSILLAFRDLWRSAF